MYITRKRLTNLALCSASTRCATILWAICKSNYKTFKKSQLCKLFNRAYQTHRIECIIHVCPIDCVFADWRRRLYMLIKEFLMQHFSLDFFILDWMWCVRMIWKFTTKIKIPITNRHLIRVNRRRNLIMQFRCRTCAIYNMIQIILWSSTKMYHLNWHSKNQSKP